MDSLHENLHNKFGKGLPIFVGVRKSEHFSCPFHFLEGYLRAGLHLNSRIWWMQQLLARVPNSKIVWQPLAQTFHLAACRDHLAAESMSMLLKAKRVHVAVHWKQHWSLCKLVLHVCAQTVGKECMHTSSPKLTLLKAIVHCLYYYKILYISSMRLGVFVTSSAA